MKTAFAIAALIGFAATAQAGTRFNQYPTVGGIAVNNLCDAGSKFQTLSPVSVCTKWETTAKTGEAYQGNESTCVASAQKIVTVSKSHAVATCQTVADSKNYSYEANGPAACTSKSVSVRTYGNTFAVPVYENMGEAGVVEVAVTQHTVPACH